MREQSVNYMSTLNQWKAKGCYSQAGGHQVLRPHQVFQTLTFIRINLLHNIRDKLYYCAMLLNCLLFQHQKLKKQAGKKVPLGVPRPLV